MGVVHLQRRVPAEAADTTPLTNWAGNVKYSTSRLTSATSLAQIQEFVKSHDRFKVLGGTNARVEQFDEECKADAIQEPESEPAEKTA